MTAYGNGDDAVLRLTYRRYVSQMTYAGGMVRQELRSESTQRALLHSARELFGARGFAGTSLGEVVQHAGVTKGALYHHFIGKEALFLAVFEEVERDLVIDLRQAAAEQSDPRERLRVGCRAFLKACLNPVVQQIMLLDAPAVLGWETWREIDSCHFAALLRSGLEAALPGPHQEALVVSRVQILRGALTEAALLVARSEDQPATLAAVLDTIDDAMFRGVLSPAEAPLRVAAGS